MTRYFFRRRPKPIATDELMIATWWGFTPDEWSALPAIVKQDKREQLIWGEA